MIIKKLLSAFRFDDQFKYLAKNSSYLIISSFICSSIQFVQSILIARHLGVFEYGSFVIILSFILITNQFFDFRVWELITKYGSEYIAQKKLWKCYRTIKLGVKIDAITSISAMIIAILMSKVIAIWILKDVGRWQLIMIMSITLVFINISSTSQSVLKIFNYFFIVSILNLAKSIINFLLVIVTLLLGMEIFGVVIAYLISSGAFGIACIISAITVIKKEIIKKNPDKRIFVEKGENRGKIRFLIYTNLTAFLQMIMSNLDSFLLGVFSGASSVGIYKVSKNLGTILVRITDPIMSSLYPQISFLWANNEKVKIYKLVKNISIIMIVVTSFTILLYIIFSKIIICELVGEKYLEAITPTIIISFTMVWTIFLWSGILFQSAGRSGVNFIIKSISTVISVLIWIIYVPKYGYIGTSIGYLSHFLVWSFMSLVVLKFTRILNEKHKNGKVPGRESI